MAIGDYIDQHNDNPKAVRLDRQGNRHSRKGQARPRKRSIMVNLLAALH